MKRKRKESCPSPILDDSPKRTKVQAQRKFAQGSGVNSPVMTPIRDLEAADLLPRASVLPEPVELLPMKRPNTEDFLTFLCFRGTPILPPNLNFFNAASIVADGQVHEIKGDCPKNGPIDITKCAGTSSDKPFIAFGVRKRADPIVISRQMERKRRHALALQTLRRKYQEQKMAKIRALTISKLSEKTTNRTTVKTNTIHKTETVTKKNTTMQKTKVIATKHVKVTTQTLKTALKPKGKPKMCLRSFRGKFVQKELPFRGLKTILHEKGTKRTAGKIKNIDKKKSKDIKKVGKEDPKEKSLKKDKIKPLLTRKLIPNARITRSGSLNIVKSNVRKQHIRKQIMLSSAAISTAVVKPKLRSTTLKKTVISRRKAKQRVGVQNVVKNKGLKDVIVEDVTKKSPQEMVKKPAPVSVKKVEKDAVKEKKTLLDETGKKDLQEVFRKPFRKEADVISKKSLDKSMKGKAESKKEITKNIEVKKEVKITETNVKKEVKKNVNIKKEVNLKTNTKESKKNVDVKKTSEVTSEKNEEGQKVRRDITKIIETTTKKVVRKKEEDLRSVPKEPAIESVSKRSSRLSCIKDNKEMLAGGTKESTEKPKQSGPIILIEDRLRSGANRDKREVIAASTKDVCDKVKQGGKNAVLSISDDKSKTVEPPKEVVVKKEDAKKKSVPKKEEPDETVKKEDAKKKSSSKNEEPEGSIQKASTRPTRKTKEAAAIYMEILSHKLVNESRIDDDNVSIDSFPELPNAKKTEAREIELKAQAKTSKDDVKERCVEDTKKEDVKGKKKEVKEKVEIKKKGIDDEHLIEKEGIKNPTDKTKSKCPGKDNKDVGDTKNMQNSKTFEKSNPKKTPFTPLLGKRKSTTLTSDSDSDNEVLQAKIIKADSFKKDVKQEEREKTNESENKVLLAKIEEWKMLVKPKDKEKPHGSTKKVLQTKDVMSKNALKADENDKTSESDNEVLQTKVIKPDAPKKILQSKEMAKSSESENEVLQAKIVKLETSKKIVKQEGKEKALKQRDQVLKPEEKEKTIKPNEKEKTPRPESVVKTSVESFSKRHTRGSTHINKNSESESSDEWFRIDVRVPRVKKNTRSKLKVSVLSEKNVEKEVESSVGNPDKKVGTKIDDNVGSKTKNEKQIALQTKAVLKDIGEKETTHIDKQKLSDKTKEIEKKNTAKNLSDFIKSPISNPKLDDKPNGSKKKEDARNPSDSDESTTSDINLKSLQVKQRKKKKLTKTKSSKSSQKSTPNFSDSDEEPLSKLTTKSVKSATETEKSKKKVDIQTIIKCPVEKSMEVQVRESKPKRECTKRPSNYLPMLTSSEEDEEPYFHGFNTAKEDLKKHKTFEQALAPCLDLLGKDIGRKGKVNMSNEQIEQWLKDSALAGSGIETENDAMLKFGEILPIESVPETPDTPELKPMGLENPKKCDEEPVAGPSRVNVSDKQSKIELKSPLADRKWIFKKDKKETTPNKNAFSPENECSVYAFGEEAEELVSTPFRRPSRRPSSTATSRSEDEMSKNDETSKQGQFRKPPIQTEPYEDFRCFNIPQNPTKNTKPTLSFHSKRPSKPHLDRFPEPFDDFKYKIPSSPSASSGSSAKLYKKPSQKQKLRPCELIQPIYVSDFPKPTDPPKLVEAPIFHPTDQEFQDPLEYIERIRHKAEQFGLCKIVPPNSFKPECKVSDDMRFTAYNQYVHKLLHRWGPNFKEFMAIRKYLATQNITLKHPPWIGGMEIDLPRLYQTVQSLGGLKEVIEKKKWPKVSDCMKIPKSAQDRVTKLDDIYCKYLLPYDTLSPAEREKLFDEVETYWAKRESKTLSKSDSKVEENPTSEQGDEDYESDDNEADECTVKGRNMALNAFYRIARNTMSMYFKVAEPTAQEVEQEFWRYVTQKQNHICVHSASIDCGNWGYGFAVSKNSPFARHSWNLKVLTNNSGSVLRSLGPAMGVTVPTLHVGMVFSACCWYRDPHGLPWIEYLHTGGNKIWYGIPSSACEIFHTAMNKLLPNYCRNKELWLPSDTAMVPPSLLMEHNVSLCRTVQEPGQFIVVFPKVFTSCVSTGYVVSESVYFAPHSWLKTARQLFNNLKQSCEPSMFSLDKLLISISTDPKSSVEVLRLIIPYVEELCLKEKENRIRLRNFGKIEEEKVNSPEIIKKKKKLQLGEEGDFECDICRMNLFISMVIDTQEDLTYCLEHAIFLVIKNNKVLEKFKLRYAFDDQELDNMPSKISYLIESKLQKKIPNKFSGMPTLLTK